MFGSWTPEEEDLLVENLEFFLKMMEKARPAVLKGAYFRRVVISATMTPGVQVAV